jgi:hypothetical protein
MSSTRRTLNARKAANHYKEAGLRVLTEPGISKNPSFMKWFQLSKLEWTANR